MPWAAAGAAAVAATANTSTVREATTMRVMASPDIARPVFAGQKRRFFLAPWPKEAQRGEGGPGPPPAPRLQKTVAAGAAVVAVLAGRKPRPVSPRRRAVVPLDA